MAARAGGMATHYSLDFIKHLPGSLKRDIGFVVAGPSLLLDSDELRITSISSVLGDSATGWLNDLDNDLVTDWFDSKRSNSTRLGEHFAKCIEFILRCAPSTGIDSVFYSQQVLEAATPGKDEATERDWFSTSDVPAKASTGNFLWSCLEKPEVDPDKYERRRSKKLFCPLQRKNKKKTSFVNTLGEFDFLFRLSRNGEETIQHWEVSVKFLLYVGPWEAFGLETLHTAKWKHLKAETGTASSISSSSSSSDHFLGFFLGPHAGETLSDRKKRLKNQLTLPEKAPALDKLKSLFGGSDLPVRSSAVLQGYLFYEPELWSFLSKAGDDFDGFAYGSSGVNSRHWKGWWTDLEGFRAFASAPQRLTSRWYVVPKKEWLSPVVIAEDEERYVSGVRSVDGLAEMAERVAEEASRTDRERMRRFMVAEVRRESECLWMETSRGFVVEDSWPDTRAYRPHGFITVWNS